MKISIKLIPLTSTLPELSSNQNKLLAIRPLKLKKIIDYIKDCFTDMTPQMIQLYYKNARLYPESTIGSIQKHVHETELVLQYNLT